MTKKMWDLYAPVYERAMRSDKKIYQFMYNRIPEAIRNRDVLEIATGPGLLAKHVASAAKTIVATDYSEGMIVQAKKGVYPTNLRFEVADATALPYEDGSFDAVIIANALHKIMCSTVIGKICASDHALNAVEEMSALNEGLKQFFAAHRADCPAYRELEKGAGKHL